MAGLLSVIRGTRPARMLSSGIIAVTGVLCFLYTFHVLYNLMCFLSSHNESHKSLVRSLSVDSISNQFLDGSVLTTLWDLLVDTCLLSLFMMQHSFMATNFVKNIYEKFNMQYVERSIYNAASAGALHFLINTWQPVPRISFWNVDTSSNNTLWLTFTAFHLLGWFVIYSGCIVMDISELAGLKQVYYQLSARPCPLSIKSRELQRYYAHMRHPSFTGFLIILWIHPFMTIDRFLLSFLLTMYMIMMWTIDHEDYRYHASTIKLKLQHLS